MSNKLKTIGRNVYVEFTGYTAKIPAKVDTGADSSALWASNIYIDEAHRLHFTLFGEGSKYYANEEVVVDKYSVARVRSSSGHSQIRYRATMSVRLAGRKVNVMFTLADRSSNVFPVLVGRRTLANKFVVDVTKSECEGLPIKKTQHLNEELIKDPHAFYKKYHENNDNNDKVKK